MKTVLELDPVLIQAAAEALGTKTTQDTVHAALAAVVADAERKADRRRLLLRSAGGEDLGNPETMSSAW